MRMPVGGGAAESIMDVKGQPWMSSASDPADFVGGYASFRCPTHAQGDCVLAEYDGKQIVFSAFDPVKGRKSELSKAAAPNADFASRDLSPDGSRVTVATFDYKEGNLDIIALAGGQPQKLLVLPWTELTAVARAADGKSLFLASYSSRGTAIVHTDLNGRSKLLIKPVWDIFSLMPSPDGQYLAFGSVITSANAWTIPSLPTK